MTRPKTAITNSALRALDNVMASEKVSALEIFIRKTSAEGKGQMGLLETWIQIRETVGAVLREFLEGAPE